LGSDPKAPSYRYLGRCPFSGAELSLDRTADAESVARLLAAQLSDLELTEGKMFGVLLVRDAQGQAGYLKAFSGLLQGQTVRPGWVPPLHLPAPLPSEQPTLTALESWKLRLESLRAQLEAHPYHSLHQFWQLQTKQLRERHRQSKQRRDEDRCSGARASHELEAESRRESSEHKSFRVAREVALATARAELEELQNAIDHGRQERRALSRALQEEMHEQFGESVGSLLGCRLETLFPQGVPTGTGDCCAPKLLAWAARNGFEPLALAEFWWGPTSVGGKQSGQFYPACQERCQPLLGPLLAVAMRAPVKVLYQDQHLVVVDKPSGLLTVPGRYQWNQDSVLRRLQPSWPDLLPVHRLDLETSGLLVLAQRRAAQANLRQQFAERRVSKLYQALLNTAPAQEKGRIEQPHARDPVRAGCYQIGDVGKAAITEFRLLDAATARVELRPLTGRSHQLRVHMAQALGTPIRGDRLYGIGGERLKLHAWRLKLAHPSTGERLSFEAPLPF
jgi:tRNA pseudouridine32 synthase/23S rRNA pseudouridine746 synthase